MALSLRACLGWLALFAALDPGAASAQHITIDGSLSRARTLAGPHYLIGANLGRQVGGNLFESFGIFGLMARESATFTGPGSVNNIIGRVTGGNPSSIDGAILSKIPGANVYLINPWGVVFGSQATVNVTGSFYASTANYLKMADGARFRATHPQASTLTAAPPAAFGFVTAKPPAITVDGSQLRVRGTIGLVGGPVSIRGGAATKTPAGAIDVVAVAGRGEVPVDPRHRAALTVRRFGRVTITGGSTLDVANTRGGDSVFVRAGTLTIDASTIEADNHGSYRGAAIVLEADGRIALRDAATVEALGFGTGPGAPISLSTAPGGTIVLNASNVLAEGEGNGGPLSVSTGLLVLTGGAELVSVATGAGDAGPVHVVAESILIDGRGNPTSLTLLGSVTLAAGNAGTVTIATGDLRILANGRISADSFPSSSGDAGTVVVNADSLEIAGGVISVGLIAGSAGKHAGDIRITVAGKMSISGAGAGGLANVAAEADSGTSGSAGDVSVTAGSLAVVDGGVISASTSGSGRGGKVAVKVPGQLTIDGSGAVSFTGITAQATPASTGMRAGDVAVSAGTLVVVGGGEISAATFSIGNAGTARVTARDLIIASGGAISADAARFSSGNAGDVIVSAGSLTVRTGGEISAGTFASGTSGKVAVSVLGRLTIDGAGTNTFTGIAAQANSGSTGSAGDVAVSAGSLMVRSGGEISASTFASGMGGKVAVSVAGRLAIDGSGATALTGITAQGNPGSTGSGGTVRVAAGALDIVRDGEIASGTFGAGKGGNVSVDVAGRLTIDGSGGTPRILTGISAEANPGSTGNAGDVTVSAGELAVLNGGQILDATFGSGNAGDIRVSARAILLARGGEIASDSEAGSSGNAGNVTVKTGSLDIAGGLISSGLLGAAGGAPASTGKHAGDVTVDVGGLLRIIGSRSVLRGIATNANPGTIGSAGEVRVKAGAIYIADNGEIGSGTFGAGKGGTIVVAVARWLVINGSGADPRYVTGIASQANPGSTGSAGDIVVSAGSVSLVAGGVIESSAIGARTGAPASTGNAGTITVDVAGLLAIDGRGSDITTTTDPGTVGNAGVVTVGAGRISIAEGGEIASTTAGTGAGGSVTVTTPGALSLDGGGIQGTAIAASATGPQSGAAGTVTVSAGSLSIAGGAEIASTTAGLGRGGAVVVKTRGALVLDGGGMPGTGIAASARGPQSGPAGTVIVSAGSLSISGQAQIASTTAGPGAGGQVDVVVAGDIVLAGAGPQITAQSKGGGDAGTIAISAYRLFLNNGAAISTEAETATANGGNISLRLGDLLFLTGSKITTSVHGKTGNGGNIALTAPFVILDHSDVIAQAIAGHGGNIVIDAGQYIPSSGSTVSASSALGVSGNVVITGPLVDLNGTLVVLSSELRNPAPLTRDSCAAQGPRPQSSLVEAGRGGLPEDPNATLPALYLAGRDLRLGPPTAVLGANKVGDLPVDLGSRLRCR